jgi:lysozyme
VKYTGSTIRNFEGCKLKAYRDGGGVLTIAYGHTGPDVKEGMTCTPEQAYQWLVRDVGSAETAVNLMVRVPIDQNQFNALVSLIYNIGREAFHTSTLLRKLNESDYHGASNEFVKWCHDNGEVVPGLVRRRMAEQKLFDTPVGDKTSPVDS